jgi:hypothetical protein
MVASLAACRPSELRRPPGYLNLGRFSDFQAPETYLPEKRVLVFKDSSGLSVMSTLCSYDLSPLVRQSDGSWISDFSASRYSPSGNVTHGPAQAKLPRYALTTELFQAEVDSAPTRYVFANFANEVDATWRLQ